jgi:hypothetical protein
MHDRWIDFVNRCATAPSCAVSKISVSILVARYRERGQQGQEPDPSNHHGQRANQWFANPFTDSFHGGSSNPAAPDTNELAKPPPFLPHCHHCAHQCISRISNEPLGYPQLRRRLGVDATRD